MASPNPTAALRVLHVVDSLERGGLERVVTDLATAQVRAGHDVRVFSLASTGGFVDELRAGGVDVAIGHKRNGLDWKVLRALRGAARRCDVVHAHNFVPSYYVATSLLACRGAPPMVVTCHDMGTRLSNPRLRRLFAWAVRRAARVAMVGRQVHERFVSESLVRPQQAVTVMNGIPTQRFAAAPGQREAARRTLGLPDEATVVGCVGRLVALKNHRLMIDLMPALRRGRERLHLVLVGGGVLEPELRARVRELGLDGVVHFAGERRDVEAVLPALDVFAMPSLTEGLSIALLEACAAARPIVATAVGGNVEIVHPGETGLLVPPDDAAALQTAVESLLDDHAAAARLGDAARRWVCEHASVDALRATYDEVYQQAVAMRSGTVL